MKIVHICLNGPVTDGWNYQDNLLSKYHKINGHDVSLITSQWVFDTNGKLVKNTKTDYINTDGVKVIRLPIIGKDKQSKKFKKYKNLSNKIEEEKPDIIFVHNISFVDSKKIVNYCKKNPNVILYVDNHSDFSNSATNWLSKNILHKFIWKYYANCLEPYTKKFYGVLPARVDFLVNMYGLPKEKCELLVMGADDEKVEEVSNSDVRKKIREKYDIDSDDFLIMTGGKIDPWKTQTLLLMEAVAKIDDPKVKLIVFGSVTEELKEKVQLLSDGKKVKYIGWIKSEDSYDYFVAADLVVFPGRHSVFWEQVCGLGIPMFVKYWEGTNHVDIGGNVEFLYNDSAEEIYNKLLELINDPEKYEKMKNSAMEKGKEMFSYEKIAERSIKES